MKSEAGVYLSANHSATAILKSTEPEVIGHDDSNLFDTYSANAIRDRDAAIWDSRKAFAYYSYAVMKGNSIPTLFSSVKSPIFDKYSRVIGLLGLSYVVTNASNDFCEINELLGFLMNYRMEYLIQICNQSFKSC